MRIAFLGTPHFAIPCLDMLANSDHDIVGVFCQPDRKSGRGHKVIFPPVKQKAIELGIPVFQFEKIKSEQGVLALKQLDIDLMITAAFGQLLSQEILDIPKLGCINVHASLLPKYRGAAPIQWVIMNGETKTGITTMFTDIGLDTGDMLLKDEVAIGKDETGGELYERLSKLGAGTLEKTLIELENETLKRIPQIEEESSYYPLLDKSMAKLDLNDKAENLVNKVRALDPIMKCYVNYNDKQIKILKIKLSEESFTAEKGQVVVSDAKRGLIIMASDKPIEIIDIQMPGSRRMKAKDFLLGKKIPVGDFFE